MRKRVCCSILSCLLLFPLSSYIFFSSRIQYFLLSHEIETYTRSSYEIETYTQVAKGTSSRRFCQGPVKINAKKVAKF